MIIKSVDIGNDVGCHSPWIFLPGAAKLPVITKNTLTSEEGTGLSLFTSCSWCSSAHSGPPASGWWPRGGRGRPGTADQHWQLNTGDMWAKMARCVDNTHAEAAPRSTGPGSPQCSWDASPDPTSLGWVTWNEIYKRLTFTWYDQFSAANPIFCLYSIHLWLGILGQFAADSFRGPGIGSI